MLATSDTQQNLGTQPTRLHGPLLWLARAGWLLVFLLVAAISWEMVPTNYRDTGIEWAPGEAHHAVRDLISYRNWIRLLTAVEMMAFASYLLTGLLIFWRRSADWVAIFISQMMLVFAITLGLSTNLDALRLPGLSAPESTPFTILLTLIFFVSLLFLFYIFPDGKFVPRWSRWLVVGELALFLPASVGGYFELFPQEWALPWGVYIVVFVTVFTTGIACQVYRYRRVASPVQRQQTKWALTGFLLMGVFWIVSFGPLLLGEGSDRSLIFTLSYALQPVVMTVFPLSVAVSVLRFRLWDADIVLNRTLVYGALTGLVLLVYGVIVGGVGALFQGQENALLAAVATGLVAIGFHPLRLWMQRNVNQFLYGERDDPVTVLRKLGTHLEATLAPDESLATLVRTVAQSLKLPFVALELAASGEDPPAQTAPVAEWGRRSGTVERFPLVFQGQPLGELVVAPRAEGERLSASDRRLLESIAHQAGPAIQAVQLTVRLQQSRQAIVTAREEERRRLRRELHDGLGPLLASQTLTLDAVARQMERDPATAAALLRDLKAQSQEAVRDIRQIVYGLRPPALDDLGLVEAMREIAARTEASGMLTRIEAPDRLPPLPAAVEAAAFRIVQEALSNAVRHAAAGNARVRLEVEERTLRLRVSDDGRGLPVELRAGVGIHSMRERAAELGGALLIETIPGAGTTVTATLPLA